jgi:hypothetical protein
MIQIEMINEMPGLPYSKPYRAWSDHINVCEHCHGVLKAHVLAGLLHNSEMLCPAGRELDTVLSAATDAQHEASLLN